MLVSHPVKIRPRVAQVVLILSLSGLMLVISACGGDPQVRQQASQSQSRFTALLQHAQQIGLSPPFLLPILRQEQQISNISAPFNPFSDQPDNGYYRDQAARYVQLAAQLQGVINSRTEQTRTQAQQAINTLQSLLTSMHARNLPVQGFQPQLSRVQVRLTVVHEVSDYLALTSQVLRTVHTLNMMSGMVKQLETLRSLIDLLQIASLDTTDLNHSYQQDQRTLNNAVDPVILQHLSSRVTQQYQQVRVIMSRAIPAVTRAMLDELYQQVGQLQRYGVNTQVYQQKWLQDRAQVSNHMSIEDFQAFADQTTADISATDNAIEREQVGMLVQQFHQEADAWGDRHRYYDSYNGASYSLDTGYQLQGIGSDLDARLAQAVNTQDFQSITTDTNNALFNLHMMETDYQDSTAYNQTHATDRQLLNHYQLKGQVIVVSLTEQAMRIYQNGILEQAFEVTTGRPELPSLPGAWAVHSRLSPTLFKSGASPGSPYWYPDTPIHYAILYHAGGYFIHDSWWRANYGPGTQFPHADSTGNQSFAGNGSHGCINMKESQAAWVYGNTDWNTQILIY